MATHFIFLLLALALALSSHCLLVTAVKFDVGGDSGWAVPLANDTNMYNRWAAGERFQIGDSVFFKYAEDSVMVVSEEGYEACDGAHLIDYYNDGSTTVTLNEAGFYYFISGLSDHCEKGQKMIIKVLSYPKPPASQLAGSPGEHSGAVAGKGVFPLVLFQLSLVSFGSLFL